MRRASGFRTVARLEGPAMAWPNASRGSGWLELALWSRIMGKYEGLWLPCTRVRSISHQVSMVFPPEDKGMVSRITYPIGG